MNEVLNGRNPRGDERLLKDLLSQAEDREMSAVPDAGPEDSDQSDESASARTESVVVVSVCSARRSINERSMSMN